MQALVNLFVYRAIQLKFFNIHCTYKLWIHRYYYLFLLLHVEDFLLIQCAHQLKHDNPKRINLCKQAPNIIQHKKIHPIVLKVDKKVLKGNSND